MKKLFYAAICLLAAILVMSCASTGSSASGNSPATGSSSSGGKTTSAASTERKVDSRMPADVRAAIKNAPEDAIVGVGTARMASLGQSRTISATRARAEIARQLDILVLDMVRDYTAGSEINHSAAISFQENMTQTLAKSRLQGASVVDEIDSPDGSWWTIVMLDKAKASNEINQAVAAAKLAVPAMASFNAEERMNKALDKYFGTAEIGFSDKN